jgi:hypothetical protein
MRDGKTLLMAGPPSAVKSKCHNYLGIQQGRGSPAEAAKRILAKLAAKNKEKTGAEFPRIVIDDVIRLLPPGGVEVVNSITP